MQHLEEGTIHAWLDGALPADEGDAVERHVAQCKECASLVAEARGMIAGASRIVSALDIVPGGVIPKSSRTKASSSSLWRSLRFTPSRAALAATLLIAVSTMLTLRHDTADKIVPSMAPAPAAPVASASPAATPGPRAEETRVAKAANASAPIKADQQAPARREVVDARTQMADSARPRAKPSVAEAKKPTAVAENRVAASLPPAAPAVASGGATAGEPRAALKARADSSIALAKVSADSMVVRRAARAAEAQGFARANGSGARTAMDLLVGIGSFSGCYQLTDSAAKDKSLPLGFALEIMRADPGSNVIRTVSAAGIADTIIAGASWNPISRDEIDVRLPSAGKTLSVMMRFPAGGANGIATISGDGAARSASVTRFACRR